MRKLPLGKSVNRTLGTGNSAEFVKNFIYSKPKSFFPRAIANQAYVL
ncbi:MAG: hypothetical protein V7L11_17330 [Nostoc sp.]